jgi:hypothetical protein
MACKLYTYGYSIGTGGGLLFIYNKVSCTINSNIGLTLIQARGFCVLIMSIVSVMVPYDLCGLYVA